MVHALAYGSKGENSHFRFNIDGHVGKGRQNKLEDVELVRLGFYIRRSNPKAAAGITAEEKVVLAKLKASGPFGDDLDAVIRAYERKVGGTQDGCVSPIPPNASHRGNSTTASIFGS